MMSWAWVAWKWSRQEAEGADAFMQPWKAELRPAEGISREAGLAWQCPAMERAALGGSEQPVWSKACQG